jgi:hypothetical protein
MGPVKSDHNKQLITLITHSRSFEWFGWTGGEEPGNYWAQSFMLTDR